MTNEEYSPTILRVLLGLLFIVPGLGKLMNPAMPIGMLEGLGFPAPAFFGWVLLLAEIAFGLMLLVGWQTRYAVWPPLVILVVALFTVHIGNIGDAMGQVTILFHLLGIGALVSVYLTGPGAMAVDQA